MVDLSTRPNQFSKYKVRVKDKWFGVHIEFFQEGYLSRELLEILKPNFLSMGVEMAS